MVNSTGEAHLHREVRRGGVGVSALVNSTLGCGTTYLEKTPTSLPSRTAGCAPMEAEAFPRRSVFISVNGAAIGTLSRELRSIRFADDVKVDRFRVNGQLPRCLTFPRSLSVTYWVHLASVGRTRTANGSTPIALMAETEELCSFTSRSKLSRFNDVCSLEPEFGSQKSPQQNPIAMIVFNSVSVA